MKRPALQNKQVVVLRMAFRARKVLGTFEKRAPGPSSKVAQNYPANMYDQNLWSYTMDSAMSSRKVTINCLSTNKNVLSKVNI